MSAKVALSRIVAALTELVEEKTAVHGRGAFQGFKDVMYEEGIQDDWFAYHEARLADIPRAWLEVEGVPYVDDVLGTLE